MQTDHVDLYQIHRWDKDTPIVETLEALRDLVKIGKARYIGASSMSAWQFAKCDDSNHPVKPNAFSGPFEPIRAHFHSKQHELIAKRYREQLRQRFVDWREIVGLKSAA